MEHSIEERLYAIENALRNLIKVKTSNNETQNKELLNEVKSMLSSNLLIPNKEHLDASEACIYMGISKPTLYKMNHRKLIPYMKANGKKVYYLKSDLDEYIRKYKVASRDQIHSHVNKRDYAA